MTRRSARCGKGRRSRERTASGRSRLAAGPRCMASVSKATSTPDECRAALIFASSISAGAATALVNAFPGYADDRSMFGTNTGMGDYRIAASPCLLGRGLSAKRRRDRSTEQRASRRSQSGATERVSLYGVKAAASAAPALVGQPLAMPRDMDGAEHSLH